MEKFNFWKKLSLFVAFIFVTSISGWAQTITSFPYTEGWEGGNIGSWTHTTYADDDWENNTGSTVSSGTGPSSANEGSNYIYCETSGSSNGDVFALESPTFDFSSLSSPYIVFDYHMLFDGELDGTLNLDVSTNGGTTWTTEWTKTGEQGPNWQMAYVDLSTYTSSNNVQLRFHFTTGTAGSSYAYDAAIDYVQVLSITCFPPTNLGTSALETTADISWTTGGASNANLEYGPAGFTLGSGTYVSNVSNPYTISGLSATTSYDVYVQDSCSSTDVSTWTGPLTFTTSAPVQSLPFTDGFESTLNAWSFSGSVTPATTTDQAYEGSQSLELIGENTQGDALATISFNASTGSPRLSFAYYIDYYYYSEFSVEIQEAGSSSWSMIHEFTGGYSDDGMWIYEELNLDTFNTTSGSFKIRFNAENTSSFGDQIYVDAFEIYVPADNDLMASNIYLPQEAGIEMTTATQIGLEVYNNGIVGQSGYNVSYSVDGGSFVTENISATINPDTIHQHTFAATADLSSYGMHEIKAVVSNTGDTLNYNDTITKVVYNYAVPYLENFDNVTEPNLPSGWSFINESNGYVDTDDYRSVSAPLSLDIYNSSSSSGEALMAIMPPYFGNMTDKWVTMDIYSETTADSLIVGVLDDPQDATTFTGVDTIIFPDDNVWGSFFANLSAYTGSGKYIAFRHTSTDTYEDMYIDNVRLEIRPTGPVFSAIPDTMDMGKVRYNYQDTMIQTVTITNQGIGTLSVTASAISPTNSSNFAVVDTNTYPKALGTLESIDMQVKFFGSSLGMKMANLDVTANTTTHNVPLYGEVVDATIDSFPFVETMDQLGNLPLGWTATSNDGDFTWETNQGPTGSSSTGPDGDHTTGNGYYVYTEASSPADLGDTALLITPLVDFASLSNPKMNFWYHMYGSDIDTLAIDIATGGSWNYNVDTIIGEQHSTESDPWTMHTIDLGSYSSADSIQFRVIRGDGYYGDVAIDDIAFGEDIMIDLGPDTAICEGESVTLDASYSSDWTYEWYVDTMNVVAATTQSIMIDSAGTYYVVVTGTGNFTGMDSVIVDVNPTPIVDLTTQMGPVYCASASVDTLIGTPAGGVYSGTGVTANTFDPAIAGPGQHSLHYTYTSTAGCSNSDSIIVQVNPLPVVNAGADADICSGDTVTLTATYNNLFFSEYIEGSSNNKAIELYNGTGKTIHLDNFAVLTNYNGGAWSGEYTFPAGATLNHDDVFVVANSSADSAILSVADETLAYNEKGYMMGYNGDDVRALVQYAPNGDTIILDQIGRYDMVDPGSGWDVAGVTNGTANHTMIRKPSAGPNLSDWDASAGTDSISSEWLVLPQDDYSDIGSHTSTIGTKAYASVSYLWSTGDSTQSITVAPTTTQSYVVTITDAMGCSSTDTVDVIVHDLTATILGPDTIMLSGSATYQVDSTFVSYDWFTGDTTQSTVVYGDSVGSGNVTISVTITNDFGCSSTIDRDIYVQNDIGIEDLNQDEYLTIYPNPTTGMVTVKVDGISEKINLSIFNVNGQLINSEMINADNFSKQYDLSKLAKGVYYIRLMNDEINKTQKLIIQ